MWPGPHASVGCGWRWAGLPKNAEWLETWSVGCRPRPPITAWAAMLQNAPTCVWLRRPCTRDHRPTDEACTQARPRSTECSANWDCAQAYERQLAEKPSIRRCIHKRRNAVQSRESGIMAVTHRESGGTCRRENCRQSEVAALDPGASWQLEIRLDGSAQTGLMLAFSALSAWALQRGDRMNCHGVTKQKLEGASSISSTPVIRVRLAARHFLVLRGIVGSRTFTDLLARSPPFVPYQDLPR